MKGNKIIKIIVITIILILILMPYSKVNGDMFDDAKAFLDIGQKNTGGTIKSTEVQKGSTILYNIFLGVGTAVAVVVGAILGIQFMTAGIDKKVQVKEALVAYVISCIVLFGAFGIWKLVVVILSSIE